MVRNRSSSYSGVVAVPAPAARQWQALTSDAQARRRRDVVMWSAAAAASASCHAPLCLVPSPLRSLSPLERHLNWKYQENTTLRYDTAR